MQNKVKDRELAEARRALAALAGRVPTVRVAADTRIHQSQVSRLLRGQFKRVSSNVRKLVAYASTPQRQGAPAEAAPDAPKRRSSARRSIPGTPPRKGRRRWCDC